MPDEDGSGWPARLAASGYRTHGIGKMHFMPDPHALRGFQTRESSEEVLKDPGRDDYLQHLHRNGFGHVNEPHGIRSEMYYIPQVAQMPAALHPTQWVGDRACAFIDGQAGRGPWALMASFIHPHPPFAVPTPWHKLYRGPDMPLPFLPPGWEAHQTATMRQQTRYKYRSEGMDLNLVRQIRAYYYACISFVDVQVGRIMERLERSGELDRTLILFSSDHGEYLGDFGCFGKRTMHDVAARVPLLARLPGTFAPGLRCDRPASLVDILPTMCAAAGIAASGAEGVPLGDLASGRCDRDAVFAHRDYGTAADYAIFTGDWTLWYSAPDDRELAFHNACDPQQSRIVDQRPFHPGIADLRRRLHQHLRDHGAGEALAGGDWRRFPVWRPPTHPDQGLLLQDHAWQDDRIPGYT